MGGLGREGVGDSACQAVWLEYDRMLLAAGYGGV